MPIEIKAWICSSCGGAPRQNPHYCHGTKPKGFVKLPDTVALIERAELYRPQGSRSEAEAIVDRLTPMMVWREPETIIAWIEEALNLARRRAESDHEPDERPPDQPASHDNP